ncbi:MULTISPECIES: hypothetical protein [unclassified Streptomyces]|uniref:hypothetical protein n=1 Tax=unclassified Streptomyces TaxID=2593676 RepID=UPI0013A6BF83|nr:MULTISPECIES: hypothetical protein [unclassified Streptomyces]QZZ24907.1 hypothetical protein A7X85_29225 [Streptomyces sp. ST1015]
MAADSPVVAFLAKIEHGCLILRDAESDDDVTDWDPESSNWYREGSSLIFGVQASVDGPVECEVWKSTPPAVLPVNLFEVSLPCPSGWLVLHDPNEHARMQFAGFRGSVLCSVMVDDSRFPSKVQIFLGRE